MPNPVALAEQLFLNALGWARRQQVLSWELRGIMSLARLRRNQGRIAEAGSLLAPVCGRFTEGFATADLKMTKTLLDDLA